MTAPVVKCSATVEEATTLVGALRNLNRFGEQMDRHSLDDRATYEVLMRQAIAIGRASSCTHCRSESDQLATLLERPADQEPSNGATEEHDATAGAGEQQESALGDGQSPA